MCIFPPTSFQAVAASSRSAQHCMHGVKGKAAATLAKVARHEAQVLFDSEDPSSALRFPNHLSITLLLHRTCSSSTTRPAMRPAFRPGGEAASAAPCSALYCAGRSSTCWRSCAPPRWRPLPAPSADVELMRFCGQVQELSLRLKARGGRLLVLESGAWVSNWDLGSLRRTGLHA